MFSDSEFEAIMATLPNCKIPENEVRRRITNALAAYERQSQVQLRVFNKKSPSTVRDHWKKIYTSHRRTLNLINEDIDAYGYGWCSPNDLFHYPVEGIPQTAAQMLLEFIKFEHVASLASKDRRPRMSGQSTHGRRDVAGVGLVAALMGLYQDATGRRARASENSYKKQGPSGPFVDFCCAAMSPLDRSLTGHALRHKVRKLTAMARKG
jgi:hypothetical protein